VQASSQLSVTCLTLRCPRVPTVFRSVASSFSVPAFLHRRHAIVGIPLLLKVVPAVVDVEVAPQSKELVGAVPAQAPMFSNPAHFHSASVLLHDDVAAISMEPLARSEATGFLDMLLSQDPWVATHGRLDPMYFEASLQPLRCNGRLLSWKPAPQLQRP
jgi:hypothetical protein